jgi:hypothetical protein
MGKIEIVLAEVLPMTSTTVFLSIVTVKIIRRCNEVEKECVLDSTVKKHIYTFMIYPLIMLCCDAPLQLLSIYELIDEHKIQKLELIFLPLFALQGFLNSIVYGRMTFMKRSES